MCASSVNNMELTEQNLNLFIILDFAPSLIIVQVFFLYIFFD